MSGILIEEHVKCPYCGYANPVEWEVDEGDNHKLEECGCCEQPFVLFSHVLMTGTKALKVAGYVDKPEDYRQPERFTPFTRAGYPQSVGDAATRAASAMDATLDELEAEAPPHAEDR